MGNVFNAQCCENDIHLYIWLFYFSSPGKPFSYYLFAYFDDDNNNNNNNNNNSNSNNDNDITNNDNNNTGNNNNNNNNDDDDGDDNDDDCWKMDCVTVMLWNWALFLVLSLPSDKL